ncbi:unnamed protein product [Prorocentrum cordatum]|uniref:Uncharacterized protein n=1 Tax=Prorocentrum cordatum TaxID=2364126 RepID=A0ABN9V976_9DINO|nr:unnamed protein product [Polarella glacialis]
MHHTTPPAPHASFGLEIPDVRLARLTRQALLAATGAAALSVLSQVLELALGSVGGSAVGVSIFGSSSSSSSSWPSLVLLDLLILLRVFGLATGPSRLQELEAQSGHELVRVDIGLWSCRRCRQGSGR